jgi:Bacterial regulatory proteins, luxR family
VVQLIAEGHSSKQIPSVLKINLKTVERCRAAVMRKLEPHDRSRTPRNPAHAIIAGYDLVEARTNKTPAPAAVQSSIIAGPNRRNTSTVSESSFAATKSASC